ncbi:molybdate ABC transporter substrate-binding protein [Vibrio algarum]|uniref:Molybdate ABC transporter substrate-binding protein n=1 Tax=Vibrio algarum TaxID=3020714 RepID=A0ABT4YRG3_9VIBR|nr:molybdate ABC transporter substrate-binding protein [Vibrio sp. KJ40-1]MDB1124148.1 molybdate ABC transporter substrate-binding protein [Vibrio sp. KJ40-1]
MNRLRTFIALIFCFSHSASAETVMIAVANNFYGAMQVIAKDFKKLTGHDITLSTGTSGQLYAQVVNGAPFDLFLSADKKRPTKLVEAGYASDSFTYAYGSLVLWSPDPTLFNGDINVLLKDSVKHIAMANPKLAPYGFAAQQVMENAGIYESVQAKFVMSKGLNAAYQFVVTENAQVGFLAKSQLYRDKKMADGSYWDIPNDYYDPIMQDAILLNENNTGAVQFVQYLNSDRARDLMALFGYL